MWPNFCFYYLHHGLLFYYLNHGFEGSDKSKVMILSIPKKDCHILSTICDDSTICLKTSNAAHADPATCYV